MVDFSVYIHIPFCIKKCGYCNFYVIPDKQSHKELFFKSLKQEISHKAPLTKGMNLISIYFGGGTPSLAGSDKIKELLDLFSPSSRTEITLEANPERIGIDQLKAYHAAGINRLSLGVQSFDRSHLLSLTRAHTPEMAENAVLQAVGAGITNISIDLMYDIPQQTEKSWEESLIKASSLPLTHISLYNLTIEPHTSFFKNPPSPLPEQLSLKLLEMAVTHLEATGFSRYELSAFARGPFESKHNLGYWTARPFLGFGPSAFSYWEGVRFRNVANLHRYAKRLSAGVDPLDFSEKLEGEAATRELLAIELRLVKGVAYQKILDPLIEEGLLVHEGQRVALSAKGKLFYDTVAERII